MNWLKWSLIFSLVVEGIGCATLNQAKKGETKEPKKISVEDVKIISPELATKLINESKTGSRKLKEIKNRNKLEESMLDLWLIETGIKRDSTIINNINNWGDSTTVDYMIREGFLNYLKQNYSKSVKNYSKAQDLSKEKNIDRNVLINILLGRTYDALGNHKKAHNFYDVAIKKNKENGKIVFGIVGNNVAIWSPLYFKGNSYEKQGEFNKAIECYLKAIEESEKAEIRTISGEVALLHTIGRIYCDILGDIEKGFEYLLKAREKEEKTPKIKIK